MARRPSAWSLFRGTLECRCLNPSVLKVGSTACIGIGGRKGAGRVRHIHTPTLWLQGEVARGRIVLEKEAGTSNVADLGTKLQPNAVITKIMRQLGFVTLAGRSRMALRAANDSGAP